ncbi:MAG: recombinase family protein [Dehalococcoidia bacterium]|nr:MAG: recombinase family protein [Dehalococcoidia bacterium]
MPIATGVLTQRAVGYLRVSSPGQTGERHSSLETQESRFCDFCRRHSLIPVATFTDIVTGRRDDRKEYRRMVEFVVAGGADFVIVQWLDRFGRNPREILRRYWDLEEHGIKVVPTDEDIKEELVLLLKAGMAGAESRRTSERVRANMGRAISKGVHVGRPPYGLKRVAEVNQGKVTARWEIDPEEKPVVKEMVRLALEENLGYKAIGDKLTATGYRARGGRPFAAFTVHAILTNPTLCGTLVYGRKPRKGNPKTEVVEVPKFFPPILSKQEWQRLQERLSIRRESPRGQSHASVYLLGGIARCGHCGGPMVGKVSYAHKGKQYRNYYCSRAMRSRGLCAFYNGHSAPKLEKAILDYLKQFSDPKLVKEYLAASDRKEVERREAELCEVEKRLADYEAQFFVRLNDLLKRKVLSDDEFAKANQAARTEAATLETRKAELKALLEKEHARASLAESLPRSIESFVEEFEHADVRQQKAELQTILKEVRVYKDMRLEVEFRD